jgi:hypothetical protein
VRPFLGISRQEILAAAQEWKVEWREDGSNQSTKYERNWLRLELLPMLEKRRPGVGARLAALAEEAAGLKKAPAAVDLFSYEEGISFARLHDLRKISPANWKDLYRLNRRHTLDLAALLKKGSGKCRGEGVCFQLSQGILLAERKKTFSAELVTRDGGAESPLGSWRASVPLGTTAAATGEKMKKQFQAAKVPIFFRRGILLAEQEGRLRPIIESGAIQFTPSELGLWWLSSLRARGDRAAAISR